MALTTPERFVTALEAYILAVVEDATPASHDQFSRMKRANTKQTMINEFRLLIQTEPTNSTLRAQAWRK